MAASIQAHYFYGRLKVYSPHYQSAIVPIIVALSCAIYTWRWSLYSHIPQALRFYNIIMLATFWELEPVCYLQYFMLMRHKKPKQLLSTAASIQAHYFNLW